MRWSKGWSEPRAPSEVGNLFAARCEAVWSDTAKLLHTPAQGYDVPQDDETPSRDTADEFVGAERMASLWYGDRKLRRRRS